MDVAVARATALLAGRRTLVVTGAGVSTDSGIPDYRGPGTQRRSPMMYAEFRSDEQARVRYWARSHLGWRRVANSQPNDGHRAVAEMEHRGAATAVITQNVDGLHSRAGSRAVVELHGRLADVLCLDCGDRITRADLHKRLAQLNPGFDEQPVAIAPDGDVDLAAVDGFRVAGCEQCGGVLKPDVVFFGENVPPARVMRCFSLVDAADALLVAGSSLTVLSGFRFVRHAHSRDVPIVIVNRGPTRGDGLAAVKIDAGCSETLTVLAAGG
ncbi:MAG TPA: NAD-dependent protein deacetylase [Jiangellaceae bacterium]|nr:NAD-dependent protein deacetylase [Jiangellaceae bacterium]